MQRGGERVRRAKAFQEDVGHLRDGGRREQCSVAGASSLGLPGEW